MVGWGQAEGLPDGSGEGGRTRWEGGHLWASGLSGLITGTRALSGLNTGTEALSGLNSGTGALSGLNTGTGALSGLNSGTGALSGLNSGTGALSGLNSGTGALSSLVWHSPRAILSSPSAAVQGTELFSTLTLSAAFSLLAGVVDGSHTLNDIISSSGSVAILSSVVERTECVVRAARDVDKD